MTTLMSWLTVLLAVSLSAVAILALVLDHMRQKRWMRIFSEKQGIPAHIMESSKPPEPTLVVPKKKHRISVPVPGAQLFRKP